MITPTGPGDERAVDELHGLQGRLQPVGHACSSHSCVGALRRIHRAVFSSPRQGGSRERAWVAQPKIDSCHTVWMELHEDLLATLGLERLNRPMSISSVTILGHAGPAPFDDRLRRPPPSV